MLMYACRICLICLLCCKRVRPGDTASALVPCARSSAASLSDSSVGISGSPQRPGPCSFPVATGPNLLPTVDTSRQTQRIAQWKDAKFGGGEGFLRRKTTSLHTARIHTLSFLIGGLARRHARSPASPRVPPRHHALGSLGCNPATKPAATLCEHTTL